MSDTVKVHVTLHRSDLGEMLGATLAALQEGFGLTGVKRERAAFLGIATGDMPEDSVEPLRASGLVAAVALDRMRWWLGGGEDGEE
jgi:hypothetical protein